MANPQQLNWSYFYPEFAGKPEDVEAHMLKTNDWMEPHDFPEGTKVRRFCLTLTRLVLDYGIKPYNQHR